MMDSIGCNRALVQALRILRTVLTAIPVHIIVPPLCLLHPQGRVHRILIPALEMAPPALSHAHPINPTLQRLQNLRTPAVIVSPQVALIRIHPTHNHRHR